MTAHDLMRETARSMEAVNEQLAWFEHLLRPRAGAARPTDQD